MRWADVYVCMLADGVALRNRCPQGQADPRAAIAGGASGVTMARAGPHPRRARSQVDAMGRLGPPSPAAPALDAIARCDGPTSTSACWPTVWPSGIVALRGRLTHGPRSPAAPRA